MNFALLLDITITFLLVGTIYYVWQLSTQLQRFRDNRAEMDRFIRDLSQSIDRANIAVAGMRAAADTSGETLQKQMRAATELSDELQLMIESANNMATRLERAADTIQPVPASDHAAIPPTSPVPFGSGLQKSMPPTEPIPSFPTFSIRDPEFDPTRPKDTAPDNSFSNDEFESESERALFRALQNRRTS